MRRKTDKKNRKTQANAPAMPPAVDAAAAAAAIGVPVENPTADMMSIANIEQQIGTKPGSGGVPVAPTGQASQGGGGPISLSEAIQKEQTPPGEVPQGQLQQLPQPIGAPMGPVAQVGAGQLSPAQMKVLQGLSELVAQGGGKMTVEVVGNQVEIGKTETVSL